MGPLIRVKPQKNIIAICNCTTTNPPLMRYINHGYKNNS
jgi:hypothetical protein